MAGKHLSEDEIKYVISADSSKAQQELHKLGKSTAVLRREEKARRSAMIELEASGKKNSDQYRKLRQECKDYTRQIAEAEEKMKKMRAALDVNAMTMNQLRKYARELSNELNNTSKAASPKQYAELETRLQGVNMRIEELRSGAVRLKQHFFSMETLNVMAGNLMAKFAELIGHSLRNLTGFLTESIQKSVELAESADGITHAFNKIGTKDYLQTLRDATKGTVSDIELMKAAVKAKDFHIPLEDLGKYLAFAQLKAQQTGQSLDYMVDSIVMGLGRESPKILDNLGLSATEIKEQTKKTGDFMKGVAKIVENELAEAGETYISAADRAARRTTELENAQRALGEVLLPLKEEFADVYGQIQIGALQAVKYLVQHRDVLWQLSKVVALLVATYMSYAAAQKLSYVWSLRTVVVSKLKAAAAAVENAMLELSILRHAVLNKTMKASIALQKAFNIVLKLSPWGLVLGAITLVVGAMLLFRKRTDEATAAQRRISQVEKQAAESAAEETAKLRTLYEATQDQSLAMDKRRKMVEQLKQQYPDYFGKLSTEAILAGKAAVQYRLLTANIMAAARARAYQDEITRLAKENLEHERGINADQNWSNRNKGAYDKARKKHTEEKNYTRRSALAGFEESAIEARGVQENKNPVIQEYEDRQQRQRAHLEAIDRNNKSMAAYAKIIAQTNPLKPLVDEDPKDDDPKKNGKSSPDPDDVATKLFAHDRSRDLEEEKQAYTESLNALKSSLIKKQITQEQYDVKATAINVKHQEALLEIEKSYSERAKNTTIKNADKKKQLLETQEKAVIDQKQAVYEAYLDMEKQYYANLDKLKATAPTQPQTLQEECEAKLLILEGYYQASLQLAEDDADRQLQTTQAYEAAKAAIVADYAKKMEEEKARARQEYGLETFTDQLAARRKKIDEELAKGLLTQEQHAQAVANLEKDAEAHRLQIRQQYGLAKQQELYDAELELLKQHLEKKEISEAEYEEAIKNLKINKMKEAFDYYANLSGGAVQALQKAEEANVDAKYDAEIEAARNAGKDTAELEKKKANEKLKIQKKYADVDFAIKASQIIADTSVAIMRAYKDLPLPAAIAASALIGITGAAQLAAANAERQKIKKLTLNGASAGATGGARVATGLEKGGSIDVEREQDGRRFHAAYDPDRRGFVDKPTVIVGEGGYGHSKEWVASNAAVENPTVAPIIDIIDRAQRAGTIRTLDMSKFLLQQAQGRAAGGPIAPASPDPRPMPQNSEKDVILLRLINVLDRLESEGIQAAVALDEIDRKQQLRNRARQFGSKQ